MREYTDTKARVAQRVWRVSTADILNPPLGNTGGCFNKAGEAMEKSEFPLAQAGEALEKSDRKEITRASLLP